MNFKKIKIDGLLMLLYCYTLIPEYYTISCKYRYSVKCDACYMPTPSCCYYVLLLLRVLRWRLFWELFYTSTIYIPKIILQCLHDQIKLKIVCTPRYRLKWPLSQNDQVRNTRYWFTELIIRCYWRNYFFRSKIVVI